MKDELKTKIYTSIFGIILIAILIFAIIVFWPLLVIWSLNTLFPALVIPYNISTWFSIIIITALFKSKILIDNSKK